MAYSGNDGILTCMVQQQSNNVNLDTDSVTYEEIWKGPWSEVKNVSNGFTIFSKNLTPGRARPQLTGDYWKSSYTVPELSSGNSWIIQSVEVGENNPAGDHAEITISYKAGTESTDAGTGQTTDKDSTEWSMSWGSYNVNILAFCENTTGGRAEDIIACATQPKAPADGQIPEEDVPYSWLQVVSPDGATQSRVLAGDRARKIFNYYNADIAPAYHYPILKKKTVTNGRVGTKYYQTIGSQIDQIVSLSALSADCPLHLDKQWTFVKVADNITTNQNTTQFTVTREEEWWGSHDPRKEFYSALSTERWDMPQVASIYANNN